MIEDDEELAFADRREQVASRRKRIKQNHKSFAVKDGDIFYEPSEDKQELSSSNLIKPIPTE